MNTRVSKSPIHGKGLFARRDFDTGVVVETIKGEIVLRESTSRFAIPLPNRQTLILHNKTKYVNSSRNPNVVFDLDKGLLAIQSIQAGDELTSKYQSVF